MLTMSKISTKDTIAPVVIFSFFDNIVVIVVVVVSIVDVMIDGLLNELSMEDELYVSVVVVLVVIEAVDGLRQA